MSVLTIVIMFSMILLLPDKGVPGVGCAIIFLTVLSRIRHWQAAFPLGIFCSVCFVSVAFKTPYSQVWLGLGFAAYIVVIKKTSYLKENLHWFRKGKLDREVYRFAVLSGILSTLALTIWFFVIQPDISDLIEIFLPKKHMGYLVTGGLLFSLVNAAVEELAFRGVIMNALDETLGTGNTSLILQSAVFGILHVNGFPSGWLGVFLAGLFGALLGIIRRKAGGMLAPWITHVFIDIVIVTIIAIANTA